ncbi:MAG: hypothetical protein ACRBF0_16550 [Calditrichia bacterium]
MVKNIVILSLLFSMTALFGQIVVTEDDDINQPLAVHKNEGGFSISLASNGIGIGGFYRIAMPNFFYTGVNLEFFVLRDDKETDIAFNTAFGPQVAKFNDINRFFTVPLNVELKKRIFTSSIENNFRPHLLGQTGVVFGMNFPNTVLVEGVEVRPDNQYEISYNLVGGIGVDFATRENYFATVRLQYRYVLFNQEIASKENHSAIEIKFEIGGLR